jgi:nitrite reductase/ring-hydroxylating ferredoxin subunit
MSKMTRRNFLNLVKVGLAGTGMAVVFAPIVAFFYPTNLEETPSEPVSAGPADELPVNSSTTIRFGRYPALVINTPDGLRAYSAVCTHFACIVKWNHDLGEIECPCHDGYFDTYDGSVISGPPPTALESFPVEVVDGQIFVGGQG